MNPAEKTVSVVIPCLNEEKHIQAVLDAISVQSYPLEKIEVVIADGNSSDGTLTEINSFKANNPGIKIKVISNPRRNIPSALNLAIQASLGDIIVRMDAHAVPERDYIRLSVENLENPSIENVGGLWIIQSGNNSWVAKSIAIAASHPLGVGDARYRYSLIPGFVETVPFGAFRSDLFARIGLFDETLLTNEDYEFNTRIQQNGGKVFYDPRIKSTYYARGSISSLARQYWRYGFWKVKMLRKYPDTIRVRQALPPIFVLSLFFGLLASLFLPQIFIFVLTIFLIYFMILVIGTLRLAFKNKDASLLIGVPLAISVMHFCWGSGFVASVLTGDKGYN